jgi:glutathione S-transferase
MLNEAATASADCLRTQPANAERPDCRAGISAARLRLCCYPPLLLTRWERGSQPLQGEMPVASIRVYTFANLFQGLPAGGPFDLKLLAWLNLAGIPYDHRFQDDTRRGPKGKNPWIELGSERIGDTEIIMERLGKEFGVDLDAGLAPEQAAVAHAWRRTFEEHFHQIFEWELLVHPAGAAFMRSGMVAKMPPVLGSVVFTMMQRGMARQLHARGIARHSPDVIEAKGRHDVDALSAFLGDRLFLVGDRPCVADASIFGQLAPMLVWPMETPVAQYVRTVANLVAYCERMRTLCFPAKAAEASGPATEELVASLAG